MKYLLSFLLIFENIVACAQDNYEIQVHASPTQAKNSAIFNRLQILPFLAKKKL
jgi:hypothetical protein